LDTSYVNVDINPTYVRVSIKGKILQLTLPCEVCIEKSNIQRNTTTGSLVINMARLIPSTLITRNLAKKESNERKKKVITIKAPATSKRVLLEIGPAPDIRDFLKITENPAKRAEKIAAAKKEKELKNFEDNPDIPPLE